MSIRRYLCDIVEGTEGGLRTLSPAIAEYTQTRATSFLFPPQNEKTGDYESATCIAIVDTDDHSVFDGDPRIDPLPDEKLDKPVSEITEKAKMDAEAVFAKRNMEIDAFNGKETYRHSVESIGKAIHPDFKIESLYIPGKPESVETKNGDVRQR